MSACPTPDPHALRMLAFQAGDADSFDRLLEEHRGMVIGYIARIVRDRWVAEELAQEVFLRVCRVRNYQPTAKFRTWLFRIATNVALNWVRDQRAEAGVLRLDAEPRAIRPYELRSRVRSIEECLVEGSTRREVRSAVESLPERQRTAVVMHKYMDMEYRDIARQLNCSVPALKSLLFRTYALLRRQLAHLNSQA